MIPTALSSHPYRTACAISYHSDKGRDRSDLSILALWNFGGNLKHLEED